MNEASEINGLKEPLPIAVHQEFDKRVEREFSRINKRLEMVEKSLSELQKLTISVAELAANMKGMLKELEGQGRRLSDIEARDGEKWRTVVSCIITAIIGIAVGVFVKNG